MNEQEFREALREALRKGGRLIGDACRLFREAMEAKDRRIAELAEAYEVSSRLLAKAVIDRDGLRADLERVTKERDDARKDASFVAYWEGTTERAREEYMTLEREASSLREIVRAAKEVLGISHDDLAGAIKLGSALMSSARDQHKAEAASLREELAQAKAQQEQWRESDEAQREKVKELREQLAEAMSWKSLCESRTAALAESQREVERAKRMHADAFRIAYKNQEENAALRAKLEAAEGALAEKRVDALGGARRMALKGLDYYRDNFEKDGGFDEGTSWQDMVRETISDCRGVVYANITKLQEATLTPSPTVEPTRSLNHRPNCGVHDGMPCDFPLSCPANPTPTKEEPKKCATPCCNCGCPEIETCRNCSRPVTAHSPMCRAWPGEQYCYDCDGVDRKRCHGHREAKR